MSQDLDRHVQQVQLRWGCLWWRLLLRRRWVEHGHRHAPYHRAAAVGGGGKGRGPARDRSAGGLVRAAVAAGRGGRGAKQVQGTFLRRRTGHLTCGHHCGFAAKRGRDEILGLD